MEIQPDLFLPAAGELEALRAEVAEKQIKLLAALERLARVERNEQRILLILLDICKNARLTRCEVMDCAGCQIMENLERSGVWSPAEKAAHEAEIMKKCRE